MSGIKVYILVIHSLFPSFWSVELQKGFEEELRKSSIHSEIEAVYTPTIGENEVIKRIHTRKPDLVVFSNDPTNSLVIEQLMMLRVPTFFTSIADTEVTWIKDEWRNFQTGVFGTFKAVETVSALQKMCPVKTVGIVGTSNPTISNIAHLTARDLLKVGFKVLIDFSDDLDSWKKKTVEIANKSDAIFPLIPYGIKKNGTPLIQSDWGVIGAHIREHIHIPTLAIGTMRRGPIDRLLGLIIEPYHLGVQTASQVYRYIKGTPVNQIPFESPIFHELQINTNEATRLGISIPNDFYGYATLIH